MTSTQHVRVEGTSYQRGRQYGRQAAARIRLSVQAYQQIFAHFADWDLAHRPPRGGPVRGADRKVMPAYLEELRASRTASASTWSTCWRSTCAPR